MLFVQNILMGIKEGFQTDTSVVVCPYKSYSMETIVENIIVGLSTLVDNLYLTKVN